VDYLNVLNVLQAFINHLLGALPVFFVHLVLMLEQVEYPSVLFVLLVFTHLEMEPLHVHLVIKVMLKHLKDKVLVLHVHLVSLKVQQVKLNVHRVNMELIQISMHHKVVHNVILVRVNLKMDNHHVKIVHLDMQLELKAYLIVWRVQSDSTQILVD
jgi:hypothetical protein